MTSINNLFYIDIMKDYHNQCIEILANSFTEFLIREEIMKSIYISSFIYLKKYIDRIFILFGSECSKEFYIEKFKINKMPFLHVQIELKLNIMEFEKYDERKMIFQAIFLMLLRLKISCKYKNIFDFLIFYEEFIERSNEEKQKLFNYANWMDLLFYTMKPNLNKGFALDIITRLCEGRDIKYNTGSGQTKPTKDRVLIFYRESNTVQLTKVKHTKIKI